MRLYFYPDKNVPDIQQRCIHFGWDYFISCHRNEGQEEASLNPNWYLLDDLGQAFQFSKVLLTIRASSGAVVKGQECVSYGVLGTLGIAQSWWENGWAFGSEVKLPLGWPGLNLSPIYNLVSC